MSQKYRGNKGIERIYEKTNPLAKFFVLIYDVGGDGGVSSRLWEQAERMIKGSGYSYLIGLRDLYPAKQDQRDRVISTFYKKFDNSDYKYRIKYILAIMEIEAWFLLDRNLFIEMAKRPNDIECLLNNECTELYPHPSKLIDQILRLIGKEYKKNESDSYKITNEINFTHLCCSEEIRAKSESWHCFIECVNDCFS